MAVQVNIRLSEEELTALEEIVQRENDRLYESGFPPTLTVSGLVRHLVQQRIGAPPEEKEATSNLRPATGVTAALEKLRGGRKTV